MHSHPKFQGSLFRTISESRFLDHILLWGHAHDMRGGRESEARLSASRTLERAVKRGLAFERGASTLGQNLMFLNGASGERLFDPAEALNDLILAGANGEDDFWETQAVATSRQMVRDFHGLGAGDRVPMPAELPPRRFRVRMERDFDLTGFERGTQVRLRLPAPLADATPTELEVRPGALEGARISSQPGNVAWQFALGAERRITLVLDASFLASPESGAGESLTARELDLYTRPGEGFIQVDATIREVAALQGADPSDPAQVLGLLFGLVARAVHFGLVQYGDFDKTNPSARAWTSGWADCQQGAALFCALCRARGIPARLVGGHFLYAARCSPHFWAEAWIEGRGWLPYDFMEATLTAGGRDPAWNGVFQGVLDYRMKVQVFPLVFTGTGSIRFPRWWHMVSRVVPQGVEVTYEDALTGALIYRDRFIMLE
ncbi:MAG: transglutaminase-like domain-containing protein [Pseudomonadota bacterium]